MTETHEPEHSAETYYSEYILLPEAARESISIYILSVCILAALLKSNQFKNPNKKN